MADTAAQNLTVLTAPATGDGIIIVDDLGGSPAVKIITLSNLLNIVNGLTEDTAPNGFADFVLTYDTSANAVKKVLANRMGVVDLVAQFFGYVSPADSTTYYFGLGAAGTPSTTANTYPITIRRAGEIYAIDLYFVVDGTLASAETFTAYFRLNNTTDTTISSSCRMNAAVNTISNAALSIAIASGDTFEIKFTTPAWATNPTNVRGMARVWMK